MLLHATVLRDDDRTDPDGLVALSGSVQHDGVRRHHDSSRIVNSHFTAVVTTGIYCRLGCGGRPLRAQHAPVRLRGRGRGRRLPAVPACRPDREPEPGWVDAPELVCRALRLIADGALDGDTRTTLAAAARCERAPPAPSVRAARRRDTERGRAFASRPLRPSTARRHRPADDAASAAAAGFQSVRHMNRVMKQVFRFTPQELRARRRDPHRLVADGGLELRLPYRAAARVGGDCSRSSRRARSPASSTSTSTPASTAARCDARRRARR